MIVIIYSRTGDFLLLHRASLFIIIMIMVIIIMGIIIIILHLLALINRAAVLFENC